MYRHKGALQNATREEHRLTPRAPRSSAPARRRPPPPPRAHKTAGGVGGARAPRCPRPSSACSTRPPSLRHPPSPPRRAPVAAPGVLVLVPLVPLIRQRASLALGHLQVRVAVDVRLVAGILREGSRRRGRRRGSPAVLASATAAALPPSPATMAAAAAASACALAFSALAEPRWSLIGAMAYVGAGRTPGVQMSTCCARSTNLAPSLAPTTLLMSKSSSCS